MKISLFSLCFFLASSSHAFSAVPKGIVPKNAGIVPPLPQKQGDANIVALPQVNLNAPSPVNVDDGKASMGSEIFSLSKTIIGASCFGLPSAIAAFGDAPSAVVSASILILLSGAMSGYGFSLIGRVCAYTGATSYQEAWAKTVSEKTAWTVSAFSILVCLSSLLAYTMVLTQTTASLFNIGKIKALTGLMVAILLPLCRLRELSRLAPFALMGIAAIVYTVACMGLRFFTGAYAAGGAMASSAANSAPVFGTIGAAGIFSPAAFVLISMLSTAFSSHYNAPKFYTELRDNTIQRFNAVVMSGYALSAITYILVASFGFLTFGPNASAMVLADYSKRDGLLKIAQFAVAGSILTSYPLTFNGLRGSLLDIAGVEKRSPRVMDAVTVGLLSLLSVMALTVKDLGAVWAIGGATYGTALTVLIPPLMFVQCVRKNWRLKRLRREIPVAVLTAVLGLAMGIIGTLQAAKKYQLL